VAKAQRLQHAFKPKKSKRAFEDRRAIKKRKAQKRTASRAVKKGRAPVAPQCVHCGGVLVQLESPARDMCLGCGWTLEYPDSASPNTPESCPRCGGRLEIAEDSPVGIIACCRGGEKVTSKITGATVPFPSCGWTGRMADYGKTWR